MNETVVGEKGMAVAPHRAAVESAAEVMRGGGNAVAAMIAAAATIAVVYPHMNTAQARGTMKAAIDETRSIAAAWDILTLEEKSIIFRATGSLPGSLRWRRSPTASADTRNTPCSTSQERRGHRPKSTTLLPMRP